MDKGLAALFIALAVVLGAAGCDDGRGSPATAKGDTPIRFVICSAGDRDCFVAARFDTFESCESHKQVASYLCDRRTPGQITCTAPGQTTAVSYCTK
jgi:hypothetical protein